MNLEAEKHLVIFDGYSFVFRAFHSLPPLTDLNGTPVGAVYGFTSMLMKTLEEMKATHAAVIFDSGTKNFRHDIYKEYKANRPPAPEELIPQFPLVRDVARAFNLKIFEIDGLEADDIIAYFAKIAKEQDIQLTIVSSDKDLMQLVTKNIRMYDSMKEKIIGPDQVVEKFDVTPDKVLDLLSLTGDSSDNIPGVPSIGPKTAALLLNEFGNLDNLYASLDKIPQAKRRETLANNKEQAYLSKELVTLRDDIGITVDIDTLKYLGPEKEMLFQFLKKYNFKSLLSKFEKKFGISEIKAKIEVNADNPLDLNNISKLIASAKYHGIIAIHANYEDKNLVKLNFVVKNASYTYTIPALENLGELNFTAPKMNSLGIKELLKILEEVFLDQSITKISYDIKKIIRFFQLQGFKINFVNYHDVMLISYLLTSGLDKHLESDLMLQYFGSDDPFLVANLLSLKPTMLEELAKNHLTTLYERVERNLPSIIAKMEDAGIKVDEMHLRNLSKEFEIILENLQKQIYQEANCEFNIGSPKQLGEVLFETLSIPNGKKSKTGAYGTDAEVLEDLSEAGYPIADKVIEWRQISKLKSTYSDSLVKLINPRTGRIHSTFSLTTTTTGRLSSNNPNLQNIPTRTEMGKKIREAFVSPPEKLLLSADYSQIELRLLAHIGNVTPLINAFKHGKDVHAATASDMFHVDIDKVDDELRRKAKTINFGIIYGVSAFGLARRIGISKSEAKIFIDRYFEKYPGIRQYMDLTIADARAKGYVTSLFGRKVFVKDINSNNPNIRQFSERAAINAPLQATSADIIKKAMVAIDKQLEGFKDSKLILQIHDELLFETTEKESKRLEEMVKKTMENQISLNVPLTVNVSISKKYG